VLTGLFAQLTHAFAARGGFHGDGGAQQSLLTVNSCIKVRLDLQVEKSPVVVKVSSLEWSTQGIESVEQCAMQGFNLVKQGKLSFKDKLHLIY
jgi:hypothetical protein